MPGRWTKGLACYCLLGISGCDRAEKEGAAPPPSERPIDDCEGVSASPVAGLPAKAGGFCIDPRSDVRRYGIAEAAPLDAVCAELFSEECELYKSHGLLGVKTVRYVAGAAMTGEVSAIVSTFRRSEGAFGFFTQRVRGPEESTRAPLARLDIRAGRAVVGDGSATVWRGKSVVELSYVSADETDTEMKERSQVVLGPLCRAIAETLTGPTSPPREVLLLESLGPDPLGVSVETDGLLGVSGTGPGTLGFFSGGKTPHRVLLAARRDEEGSADLMNLLRRSGASNKLKGRDVISLRRTQENAPPETWYLVRRGAVLLGVGPLRLDAPATRTTPEQREDDQEEWEKFAVQRVLEVARAEATFSRAGIEDSEERSVTPSAE